MTIAAGVNKKVSYKAESAWGSAAGASGGQVLRRVSSTLDLQKAAYRSAEIKRHLQQQDMRHGVRSVAGSINGELSPGTYKDFIAAAVRRAYAAVSAITSLSITITGSSAPWTVARASGSWLTDGIKVGMVGRLTAGSFAAGNLNNNLLVTGVTASNLTVITLNGSSLTAEGPISSATFTPTGKVTYAPASGHTDASFSIEHFYSDISQSELFTGCKVSQCDIALPPTGMSTIALEFMGKDVTTASSEYFSSPTAETTTGLLASVNGALYLGGSAVALLTGLNFSINGNLSAEPVVGSNVYPDIAEGKILVTGQMTVLLQDAIARDYFINETEVSLIAALTASSANAADFMTFTFPRIKIGGGAKDDGEKKIVMTMPFEGLYNSAGGSGVATEATTLMIQDSQA